MDADIAAATTAFELDKIKAQDYRNALASQKVDRAAQLAVVQGLYAWAQAEYTKLPPETPYDRRWAMTLAIADKYMSASTAIDPALVLADAQKDAARLRAAVDEAMKV